MSATLRREFFYHYECLFIIRDKCFFITGRNSVLPTHLSVLDPYTGLPIISMSENLAWKIDIVAKIKIFLMYFLACLPFQMCNCLDLKFCFVFSLRA